MGTKENPGRFDCYTNAEADEPMFVLLGRDPQASRLVRQWATERANRTGYTDKVSEALRVADEMDNWRNKNCAPKLYSGGRIEINDRDSYSVDSQSSYPTKE